MKKIIIIAFAMALCLLGCQSEQKNQNKGANETNTAIAAATPEATDEQLAGKEVSAGIYLADYISLSKNEVLAKLAFDAKNHLDVVKLDGEGKEVAKAYDILSGKAQDVKSEEVLTPETPEDAEPSYLIHADKGETLIHEGAVCSVSLDTKAGNKADDYVRIYQNKKMIYSGNLMAGSDAVIADSTADGKYVMLSFQKGDYEAGEKIVTETYVVCTNYE